MGLCEFFTQAMREYMKTKQLAAMGGLNPYLIQYHPFSATENARAQCLDA